MQPQMFPELVEQNQQFVPICLDWLCEVKIQVRLSSSIQFQENI